VSGYVIIAGDRLSLLKCKIYTLNSFMLPVIVNVIVIVIVVILEIEIEIVIVIFQIFVIVRSA
jgi:hypothetical protein